MKIKKWLVVLMAVVMVIGSSMTVLAADETTEYQKDADGNPIHDVTGSYSGELGVPVYSYMYSFGDMNFNYSAPAEGTWNPETHGYEGTESKGGWSCANKSDEITVINHSNRPISVILTFQSAIDGVKFGFTKANFKLDSAVGTTVDNAPGQTVRVGAMSGSAGLSEGQTNVKVGTVTLHVTGE